MALRDFATPEGKNKIINGNKIENTTLDKALQMPEGVSEEEFFEKYCPPLPLNFEPQKDEPKALSKLLELREFRIDARNGYTDKQWRMHRWAYHRLTEQADRQIQMVLDAIKASGEEENTLIIFSSDHGDMDAAHRMEHKTALYEESAGVPFMAMWKGHIPARQVDDKHLVSNGLDLLPTVCDYAGIKGVADSRGKSLRPLFEGKNVKWRKTLGVETEIGRMVVSENKLKYIKYDAVGIEEQLIDLKVDPYEMTHFTNDSRYKNELEKLRKSFQTEWFRGY
jgi:choline-sulfatase